MNNWFVKFCNSIAIPKHYDSRKISYKVPDINGTEDVKLDQFSQKIFDVLSRQLIEGKNELLISISTNFLSLSITDVENNVTFYFIKSLYITGDDSWSLENPTGLSSKQGGKLGKCIYEFWIKNKNKIEEVREVKEFVEGRNKLFQIYMKGDLS